MLFIKVLFSLLVYQKYCVGNNIFRKDIVKGISTKLEELQTTTTKTIPTKLEELQTTTTAKDLEITTQTKETSVTDGKLTTKPDEIQTTTTESGECPRDKSLHSQKDIRAIIDYIFNGLGLKDAMIENIVPQAVVIKDKHTEDLNQFEAWFKNQPEHLIHVLEGLSAVRKQQIEPEAQKIAVILQDYPQVKELMDEKQLKMNKLTKKLMNYENLCKYNCEDLEEPNRIFKRSIPEEYLCSSIADLHEQITTGLTENFDDFLTETKNTLLTIDTTFAEEIENIKIDLKDRALKEFGRTMYDVLNLEDEYHHFFKEMNSTNAQILLYAVKDLGLQIDSKLLQLQRLVEDYGKYCRSCNIGPVKRLVRHTKVVNQNENVMKNSNFSIVNKLIQDKYDESENEVQEIIEATFKDLINLINDSERKEMFFNNLKLIQNEIIEIGNIERQGLEHLKSIASQASMKKLSDLASSSEILLDNIDDNITYLKKKLM